MTNMVFFCNKRHVLLQQTCVCCNESMLVVTKLLLQQNYVFRNKIMFVTTKMILVAAPTNDTSGPLTDKIIGEGALQA